MLFNSLQFLIFFVVVYSIYLLLSHKWQNRMLLIASYVFYASWDWHFLSLIMIITVVDYCCGRQIFASSTVRRKRLFLAISIGVDLTILGFFKYFSFFASSLQAMAEGLGVHLDAPTLHVILPVGISFYTFQSMSYCIDVYRGDVDAQRNVLDYALYVALFTQLVAGPIEKAKHLMPQIVNPRRITRRQIMEGLWMIYWGFFLKVFVADNLAKTADAVFGMNGVIAGSDALMGVYAFAFQILGDFAGYSNMAIGFAKLMGFNLITNFLFPYFVTNPREFWRNWHISLSTWLRDYLYIPLGGNRGSKAATARNLFLTMLLGGLWHGAAWTFVCWGAFHGAVLVLHRFVCCRTSRNRAGNKPQALWDLVRMVFMFHLTCIGWLLFRSQSFGQACDLARSLACNMAAPSPTAMGYGCRLAFYSWLMLLVQYLQKKGGDLSGVLRLAALPKAVIIMLMFYLLVIWGEYHGQEFVYFQF